MPSDTPTATAPAAPATQIGKDLPYLEVGTAAYRRMTAILFVAGFSTFATLYCVQPLLPDFVRAYGISPPGASLSLSVTTAALAVALLVAGAISDRSGRKGIMVASLALSGGLGLASALAPSWPLFLVLRALAGLALGGLPAVAMAYVAEEVNPKSAGLTMGLYIGGTAMGGMAGRILTVLITDISSWRVAVGLVGAVGILAALTVAMALPPSRHFRQREGGQGMKGLWSGLTTAWRLHLSDGGLVALFATGFLAMGAFVTVFNYVGFRLQAPPLNAPPATVAVLFLVYVFGIISSPLFGGLSSRFGPGRVLVASAVLMLAGLGIMDIARLDTLALGLGLFTFAFFGVHSVASGWIGLRARQHRGQASALYLFAYYMGSTLAGTAGGFFWHGWEWTGITLFVGGLLGLLILNALGLAARRAQ
ncbi:Major Facilitator Superfamily [Nitrospirillum viridazoti Y2]|uniref:YNFM family putative membrane transporter n=1 Tax=Nitrospirillum amazonense TaxID=28077 RepID=A0A560IBK9_9PROT|nr:MFS transporter [Nitrospirillum amazonense]EGY01954.1 Major Facilitator Superfamily [Nitrospirillum amazonense Y2]TWB56438.1 YNFM family putative membrane transporter [Nitrospirillum amazonense]